MSDEQEATEATEAPEPISTNELLGGTERAESPFDSIYAEGALDKLPEGGVKSFASRFKSGVEFEKGLANLNKLGSSKGFERPGEDAPQDQKDAFSAKMRELNGVPEDAKGYEFEMPEGYSLPEENANAIAEFAHERGIAPDTVNAFLPFQVELQKAAEKQALEQHIESQMKVGDEYFGGEGGFDREAPALAEYASKLGFDVKNDPAFRNASTYKLLADLKNATGESPSVTGTGFIDSDSLKEQLNDLQFNKENPLNAALSNTADPRYKEATAKFLELNRKISSARTKRGFSNLSF
jgi:hypothetical protein